MLIYIFANTFIFMYSFWFFSYHIIFCPNLKILVLVRSWKTDELQSRTIELPFFAWSLLELPMYFHNNFVIIPLAERPGPSFEKLEPSIFHWAYLVLMQDTETVEDYRMPFIKNTGETALQKSDECEQNRKRKRIKNKL